MDYKKNKFCFIKCIIVAVMSFLFIEGLSLFDNKLVNASADTASVTNSNVETGVWGTAEWSYDSNTKVLTIGSGETSTDSRSPMDYSAYPEISKNVEKIVISGPLKLATGRYIFYTTSDSLPNLTVLDGVKNIDTSEVTDMTGMFAGTHLKSLDLSNWDTGKVTDMQSMFFSASGLKKLNVGGDFSSNSKNVTNMAYMFNGCIGLSEIEGLSGLRTESVTNMDHMFNGDYNLTSLDVSGFNTTNVTNMNYMFSYVLQVPYLDLSSFDTSSVTSMTGIFANTVDQTVANASDPTVPVVVPGLVKINFGKKSIFNSDTQLPNAIDGATKYSAYWTYTGNASLGELTSTQLLAGYNGIYPGMYIRKQNSSPTPTPEVSLGKVIVNYESVTGKTLDSITLSGNVGDGYKTTKKKFSGYKFKSVEGNASGEFTDQPQTVTYIYEDLASKNTELNNYGNVKVGSVVYGTKNIYLYKNFTFNKKERRASYAKKPRINRPMFVVNKIVKNQNGRVRFYVKDVNHDSSTDGKTGYITANGNYVSPTYYQTKQAKVTVINPNGIKGYMKSNLTKKVRNYKQGTVLSLKKIVKHNLTTRFVLSNGQYITANRKLVQTGKQKMVKQVTTKQTIKLYRDVNLTKRVKSKQVFKKGTKIVVKKFEYSQANVMNKQGTKRYLVNGGYITANSKFLKIIKSK